MAKSRCENMKVKIHHLPPESIDDETRFAISQGRNTMIRLIAENIFRENDKSKGVANDNQLINTS